MEYTGRRRAKRDLARRADGLRRLVLSTRAVTAWIQAVALQQTAREAAQEELARRHRLLMLRSCWIEWRRQSHRGLLLRRAAQQVAATSLPRRLLLQAALSKWARNAAAVSARTAGALRRAVVLRATLGTWWRYRERRLAKRGKLEVRHGMCRVFPT